MNQSDNKPVSFLLADDHSLIRQGIVFLLDDLGFDYEVFHASNLYQLTECMKVNPVTIAIIDAHFPDGNSLAVLPEIIKLSPKTKILIFTGIDENIHALKFLDAGAHGFLSKLNEEDEIRNAILRIIEHGEYVSQATQVLLMGSLHNRSLINPLLSLSARERQIAELYAEGYGNLEISNRLNIKQNTVSTLKKRIFEKLNIENMVELIILIKNHQ